MPQRQDEQTRRNSILATMIKIMRANGASDRSIQKALPGLEEFAKFSTKLDISSASGDNPDKPQPALTPGEEALGFLLSEIKTQEVRWLWENRIPLGKITILEGDPAMGKSLLAINIAARVSTGQSMPDDTPGKQGGVILIAPEDGAGDTLRPRLKLPEAILHISSC